MPISIHSEHRLGDMLARYVYPSDEPGALGLVLLPASHLEDVVQPREHLAEPHVLNLPKTFLPIRAWAVDRLVHVFVNGDPRPGAFAQGRTMRDTKATWDLKLRSQSVEQIGDTKCIRTELADPRGLVAVHELLHAEGARMLRVRTSVRNEGAAPLTLELLTSFSLGGITPFAADDAPGRLWIHRFRSNWSNEGRPVVERAEDLQLEPSWTAHGVRCERFGAVGSLSVSGWFPEVAVEDRAAGVTWAAQLVVPGSWQIELYRRHDHLAVSGGGADHEFGHWQKNLLPGQSHEASEAWLTVAAAQPESTLLRLHDGYRGLPVPAPEQDLPVIFNEWCSSWGSPTHENLIALADRLKGSGVKYLVIDDGWAERPEGAFMQSNGDWAVSRTAFPHGLRATAEAIRDRGLVPGIWFEFEVCNPGSRAWNETSHQLHRDGRVLEVGNRRFWDFRDPWVHEYLTEKVIGLLRDNHFGYLKVDYNDNIGLGCDGADSSGEGLRQHLEGVLRFFDRIRRELPDLVIENCSSGGHRQSAAFIARTSISSFSDAHETPNIPIIAANLIPLVPCALSQVWAVVRKCDALRRLHYSLAATFLGRMCLSGEVHELDSAQWDIVLRAITLHRRSVDLISSGEARRTGEWGPSTNHPTGWQAVVRCLSGECLVVLHAFDAAPATIGPVSLPAGDWRLAEVFAEASDRISLQNGAIHWNDPGDFAGAVVRLVRQTQFDAPTS